MTSGINPTLFSVPLHRESQRLHKTTSATGLLAVADVGHWCQGEGPPGWVSSWDSRAQSSAGAEHMGLAGGSEVSCLCSWAAWQGAGESHGTQGSTEQRAFAGE